MNKDNDRIERRCRSSLVSSGTGAMIFGVWIVAKLAMYLLFDSQYLENAFSDVESDPLMMNFLIGFVFVIAFIAMLLHFYIGIAARAEGKGKKKGYRYVVITIIMAACTGAGIITSVFSADYWVNIEDAVMTLLIDSTTLFVFCDIAVASIRLKRMGRMLNAD